MWKITIDTQGQGIHGRVVEQIPTPHLHTAIESALYKHGLSNAKSGEYQITAESA